MQAKATKTTVTLKLTTDEAIALQAVIGGMTGSLARALPWYDRIADAMEEAGAVVTMSHAISEQYDYFHVAPLFISEYGGFKPDPAREIRKAA